MDEKIEKIVSKITNRYTEIESELIYKLATHFKMNAEFINSDYWRVQKLEEMGLFNEEVIEYLAKYNNVNTQDIIEAFEKIGVESIDISNLRNLYKNGSIILNPDKLLENGIINTIIDNAYNSETSNFIEMSKKIEEATRNAYLDIVEKAYLKTSMGTHSYQEAIKESLIELGNNGIRVVDYKTTDGKIRSYNVEGLVRREILTGARQLNGKINNELINELKPEYIYISEHLDCRPTHFDWQGTLIKREELTKPLPDYPEYGSIIGICGINCRHYFEAYFGNPKDIKKRYTKNQCEEAYNLIQKQRYYERGVRAWKRKSMAFEGAGDSYMRKYSAYKTHQWQNRLDRFTKNNNIKRDYSREFVDNYKDITANILPSKSNIELLKKSGIIADDSLGMIDGTLLKRNANQLAKLTEKYDTKDFYTNNGAIYYSKDKNSIASISYNSNMTMFSINSSSKYFSNKEDFINKIKEKVNDGWFMPCKENNYDIYAMTHEYGHTLEMKMFKDINKNGNNIGYRTYCQNVKNDILSIARENNSNLVLSKVLRKYGADKKPQEFFAEVFANMELGNKNELGKAMEIYLKRNGVLK